MDVLCDNIFCYLSYILLKCKEILHVEFKERQL